MTRRLTAHAIVLWLSAPVLLSLSLYRPEGGDHGRAARVPDDLGGFRRVEDYALTASVIDMLGTPDATWRRYVGPAGEVFVVAVFHDENWKSVHAPDTCLRGSNMDIVAEGTVGARALDGRDREVGFLRMRALDRGEEYLSLYAYLAVPDFVTGDFWSFFLYHAPRALVRQSVPGCLLRVETWVDSRGYDAAMARCQGALGALVSASFEILR